MLVYCDQFTPTEQGVWFRTGSSSTPMGRLVNALLVGKLRKSNTVNVLIW